MFETEDIYLGAALQEAGFVMDGVTRASTRAKFAFPESRRLQDAVADYYSGRLVLPAHNYAERIRSAKSMAMNAPALPSER
jgi:hypothetical protein